MTSPTPPPSSRADGQRRRSAVDYQQLGYGADELPATAVVNTPQPASVEAAAAQLVMPGVLVAEPDPGLVYDAGAPVVPLDADSEEEQWWAQGEDIPAPPLSRTYAEGLSRDVDQQQRAVGARSPMVATLSRILGLHRLGSPRGFAATPAQRGDDGPADPAWLLGQPGAEADRGGHRPSAAAAAEPATAQEPRSARTSSQASTADVEVSRAPRELVPAVRRALVGLVLVLIAFAGIKQVIWNPIFGRPAPAAAGPAVMDQVSADAAATRYALDYFSFSPRIAAASAAAVSADVVPGGGRCPGAVGGHRVCAGGHGGAHRLAHRRPDSGGSGCDRSGAPGCAARHRCRIDHLAGRVDSTAGPGLSGPSDHAGADHPEIAGREVVVAEAGARHHHSSAAIDSRGHSGPGGGHYSDKRYNGRVVDPAAPVGVGQ